MVTTFVVNGIRHRLTESSDQYLGSQCGAVFNRRREQKDIASPRECFDCVFLLKARQPVKDTSFVPAWWDKFWSVVLVGIIFYVTFEAVAAANNWKVTF